MIASPRKIPAPRRTLWLAPAVVLLSVTAAMASAPAADADRTLSPYFFVQGGDPAVDKLPLKGTRADVQISGVIARVKVTQTYANEGTKPIEAVYVFPGSTRSAVFGMQMKIGDRVIVAQIQKREAARQMYEQARREGRSASLLEQQRPNVFQMNVANIMPGDTIEVELQYTELMNQEEGVYEFVYPGTVGPRYTEATEETAGPRDRFTQTPYLRQGEGAPYDWDLGVKLAAGVPIHNIVSPSHKLDTTIDGSNADVRLADGEKGGDRDFVLQYKLNGDAISTGALLFPGDDENFFLMMMQPPRAVADAAVPPREYVFIMDVSGSMRGFALDIAKGLLADIFTGLRSEDRFNVMMFSGGSRVLSPRSLPATQENLEAANRALSGENGGGGTRILPALKRALQMPATPGMSRTFVVITDGFVSVEAETFDLIQKNLNEANLFAFGVGRNVNRHLVEGMARAGMGEPFVALGAEDARTQARKFQRYIASPALTGIEVAFDGFRAYDVEPRAVPDLFAQRPIVVFGKYRGAARGEIVVTGTNGQGRFRQAVNVASAREDAGNDALRYLWARHRIARLADNNLLSNSDARVKEVTDLGLKYNLMTAYTSFIAVDSAVRNEDGNSTTVNQPLPLPSGVTDAAVGGAMAPRRMMRVQGRRGRGSYGSGGMGSTARPSPAPMAERAEESRRTPTLLVRGVTVTGALQSPVVRRALHRLRNRLRACLAVGTKLRLRLTIDASGRITAIAPMGSDAVPPCVLRTLETARFPTAAGESSAVVTLEVR